MSIEPLELPPAAARLESLIGGHKFQSTEHLMKVAADEIDFLRKDNAQKENIIQRQIEMYETLECRVMTELADKEIIIHLLRGLHNEKKAIKT